MVAGVACIHHRLTYLPLFHDGWVWYKMCSGIFAFDATIPRNPKQATNEYGSRDLSCSRHEMAMAMAWLTPQGTLSSKHATLLTFVRFSRCVLPRLRVHQTHYGAVLVGGPDEDACPRPLEVTESVFYGNSAVPSTGAGGALAIFDTSATIIDAEFGGNAGTAVLFQSSSDSGDHQLKVRAHFQTLFCSTVRISSSPNPNTLS